MSLQAVFCSYLAVFLAAIMLAWFNNLRRRRRMDLDERRIFICGFCRTEIPEEGPGRRMRCQECGAVQERGSLNEVTKKKAKY
jgi:hypothetical protein